ncbi:MAG: universal stress protein [Gemmatimonadota bacterium]|nr:universal stress protein [Gemmatimonadota bacterium]
MKATTILVPLDGSPFAETAIPAAIGAANRLHAAIDFVSVFDDASIMAGTELTAQNFKDWLSGYLKEVVTRTKGLVEGDVTFTIVDGTPVERLVEYAKRSQVELIVMSTHGRGIISRAWLGSVADRLVRHVDIPVMLVRTSEDESEPVLENLTELKPKKILVPLDGSALAEQSVAWAMRFSDSHQAQLILVRAVEQPIPFTSAYLPHAVEDTHKALAWATENAQGYLTDIQAALAKQGVDVAVEVLEGVHPARGMEVYVQEHGVDMIVMASHGRTGLARAFLGSVADKVIRHSEIPVLLVRPDPKEEARISHAQEEAHAGHG